MTSVSDKLFERAKELMPGGVNSPVRAFGPVGLTPRVIARSDGARLYDVDGRSYIDYVCSWGPMILGHNRPEIREAVIRTAENGLSFGALCEAEIKLAEAVTRLAPVEMIRMVNSGTEAVMSAIRAARGFTGRDKIIKFAGCYHGHSDGMLVAAGSGALTAGVPDSAGVTAGAAKDTLTARYNDLASVADLFSQNPDEVAAVIVEPVAANMGVVLPADGFLQGLRRLCDENSALLIFDEVITGFRLGLGGAQEYFGVRADLATYGKIIGGGMPVGAYGGRRDVMAKVAPSGPVYQAGTLSGNPVAMAAGFSQLELLEKEPQIYDRLAGLAEELASGLADAAEKTGVPSNINRVGSLCCMFFTGSEVTDYESAKTSDTARYAGYFARMLESGIYLAPSQFEAMFISAAHDGDMIGETVKAARLALENI